MQDTAAIISKQIASISDWRGDMLAKLRELIHEADSEIKEEWKWDVPVFTHNGLVCAISAFKDHVKINFFNGALLEDKHKLFNNGFTSKRHRSIDFSKDDRINEAAIKALIKEAADLNSK